MTKQRGLGKGLGALLGEAAMQTAQPPSGAQLLPLQKVEPNPLQPRKSFDPDELQALADSIAMHGIIQPLTVRQLPSGFYQIIAGERRWRAARLAGLDEVPVVGIVPKSAGMSAAITAHIPKARTHFLAVLIDIPDFTEIASCQF